MPRLLHVKQSRPQQAQRWHTDESTIVVCKRRHVVEALVPIEREGKVVSTLLRQDRSHSLQSRPITRHLAVDFDFEMPQPVETNAFFESLRQAVIDAFAVREIGFSNRIG